LLGASTPLTYKLEADGLHIQLLAKPSQGYAYAFRIALDNPPQ
jgi:hypothetical protein